MSSEILKYVQISSTRKCTQVILKLRSKVKWHVSKTCHIKIQEIFASFRICITCWYSNHWLKYVYHLFAGTKLIRTNRDEWLVKDSEKPDEEHRNRIVFILLQALAHIDPEKAFYLFKELIADQYIYYFPIGMKISSISTVKKNIMKIFFTSVSYNLSTLIDLSLKITWPSVFLLQIYQAIWTSLFCSY